MNSMQIFGIKVLLACLLLIGFLPQSHATVLFDGFGAGDSFEAPRFVSVANDDVVISGQVVAQDSDWAFAFTTPADNHYLTSIEIALSTVAGTNEVDIFLRMDDGSQPGMLLESFHLSNVLVPNGSIHTLNSLLNPLLTGNTQYWIEMSAGDGGLDTSLTGWHSSSGAVSPFLRQFDEDAWDGGSATTPVAYRVNGVASVPESTTLALMGLGLAGIGYRRQRSKKTA